MLEDYLKRFARLRTDSGHDRYPATTCHRAPHKPLLLLSVMDHIAEGVITENFIRPSLDLVETFNFYITLALPVGWKTSMAHPFPRLQKEGFWHRIANPVMIPTGTTTSHRSRSFRRFMQERNWMTSCSGSCLIRKAG
jgi:putative restriction endonuclease